MSDGVETSWYPSCVVKLTIRFDEALHVQTPRDETSFDALANQSPEARVAGTTTDQLGGYDTAVRNVGGSHRPRAALEAARRAQNAALSAGDRTVPTDSLLPGVGAAGRSAPGGLPAAEVEPLTFGTDSFTVIANRVPKKGTFTLPHPRSAPTFNLTFDYTEFPVNPQLIRAVGVEIHLGAVDSEDFARGMHGDTDEDGRPFSILKTTEDVIDPVTGRKGPNAGTLLFFGTVDTWDVDHGDKDAQIIMEGREIRAILIDAKYVPARIEKIRLDREITDVIADLIASVGFEHGFRLCVATDATEWPNGIVPSPGDADGLTRVRVKAASMLGATIKAKSAQSSEAGVQTGNKEAARSAPDNGTQGSYWDLITNYCEVVGAMPHVVGSMLWIRPVHRIFDIVDPNSRIPTPFAGGQPRTVNDERVRVRRLILGRNLRRLRLQRKFGGVSIVPTVQCISFDDRGVGQQRLICGQWPPASSAAALTKAESELLRVPMWGIRSVDRLTAIARGIYEEIGRGETGGTAETNSLASFGGDNADADLLRLRPLEPIELAVDTSSVHAALPVASDVNELERMTFGQEVDEMTRRLGDRAIARALVALARGAVQEVLRYYQVVGVTFDWDQGVKTSIQFQNYILPRQKAIDASDVRAPSDVRTRTVKVAGQGRKAAAKPRVTLGKPTAQPALPSSRPRTLLQEQQDLVQQQLDSGSLLESD
jgi:hypothetical protein